MVRGRMDMKNTKRILAVFLVAAMVMAVAAGCSSKDVSTKTKGATLYQKYINNIMEGCYYGDVAKYVEVCEATLDDAQAAHDNTVKFYAYQLMVFNGVDHEYISDEMYNKFVELAGSILAKAKFKVNEAVQVNDEWQVKVEISPIDINDTTWDEVEDAIVDYNNNSGAIDFSQMTEEQGEAKYRELQEEYAQNVYNIIFSHISTIGYKDTVSKIVIITVDKDGLFGIPDDDWNDIDDLIVDMKGKVS